jgi:RNA polymerase sigma-70 factor (ECF subfamily)
MMAEDRESKIDDALVRRMAEGDEEALRELIVRHEDRVYGTVARMIGSAGPDAEDLAQQIFLRIWKAAPKYRAEAKFTTWLMTVTRNLVFTFCDSRAKRMEVSEEIVDEETGEVIPRKESVAERTPREDLSGKELIEAVEGACAQLPMKQRLVVHLREHEDMDFSEIGEILGISELGAKSLMFRARENLKIKLSAFLTEPS